MLAGARSAARPRAAVAALTALAFAVAGAGCAGAERDRSADAFPGEPTLSADAATHALRTVFVVVLENQDWSSIAGSPSAPFINGVLLPRFAHAEAFRNGDLHPSLPAYIALEAGDPLGVHGDSSPRDLRLAVPAHLTAYLDALGIGWRAYAEGIDGRGCPLADGGGYVAHHEPFLYFDDVTGNPPDPHAASCAEHVRPYSELERDLAAGNVARYNFITPDVCHGGHDSCAPEHDRVRQSDAWLERELPRLMASAAYQAGGVVLVVWDEPEHGDEPIGLLAVSPLARPGHASTTPYSYASVVRSVEEILGVTPLLRRAGSATSLSDLFLTYP